EGEEDHRAVPAGIVGVDGAALLLLDRGRALVASAPGVAAVAAAVVAVTAGERVVDVLLLRGALLVVAALVVLRRLGLLAAHDQLDLAGGWGQLLTLRADLRDLAFVGAVHV